MPFGTLRPPGRIRELKRTGTTACLIVSVMVLTGCGFLPFTDKKDTQTPAPRPPAYAQPPDSSVSPPPGTIIDTDNPAGTAVDTDGPAGMPDGYRQVPAPPPVALTPPIDPLIAAGPLQLGEDAPMGALGINLDEYFDETVEMETRVTRVERAITAIQRDLKTLAPPIKRLITVERDIQAIVSQLTDFVQSSPAPPVAPVEATQTALTPAPRSAPQSLYTNVPADAPTLASKDSGNVISGGHTAPSTGATTVKRLRIGEHKDRTRIVLDVSGPATYR